MDIDTEVKKLRGHRPDKPISMGKMAKLMAAMFDKASVGWVAKIFWDKKFQELAEFKTLVQAEKDRIFNELAIAPLTLFMITLEAPDINQPKEFCDFLLMIRDELPAAHMKTLAGYGLERKYLADWEKLIKMRFDEFSRDKLKARQVMMEDESRGKSLEISDLKSINLVLPVFTVAVGCHRHIYRGKTDVKELLFRYLMKNLSRFYIQYRILVEGGRLTPINRLQMFLKHRWHDLQDKLGA